MNITRRARPDALVGSIPSLGGEDTLIGTDSYLIEVGAGSDDITETGTGGADATAAGAGKNSYIVANGGDALVEAAGGETDTVQGPVVYALVSGSAGKDFIHRAGDGRVPPPGYADVTGATTGADTINGFGGDDIIYGDAGNDAINGGTGADSMTGGTGNDTYFVDNAGDVVTEASGAGSDTVNTTLASYTLGANVEKLVFTGSGNFSGTGNDLNNTITGGAGSDTLRGGGGADTLIGKAGNDTMIGGAGNDTYLVDNAGDGVTEASGEGSDTVKTTLARYTLGANVEKLTYTGAGSFAGTGNALNNTITGGAGSDMLNGGAGADALIGLAGNDTYVVDHPDDVVTEAPGAGSDTVRANLASHTLRANIETLIYTGGGNFTGTGNGLANTITGGAGNDTLLGAAGNDIVGGKAGNDSLSGGAGQDLFLFDTALGAGNIDRVLGFSVVDDRILLSQSVFTAAGPVGTLDAAAFFIGAGAHDADDRIIYNNSTGALSYDPDGIGSAARTQFATLPTGLGLTLTAANFENIPTLPLLYHLQNADYASLYATGFRIGVIDMDDSGLGTSEVALLQGQGKILVTYLSIGEAEDYRAYWQAGNWDTSPPDFLLGENPDWPGNYSIKFWDPDWQSICFARIDEAIDLGYNGMYLDIVDAYTRAQVRNAYPGTNEELRQEMIDFVVALSQYAKAQQPGFLVVPQNAVGLLATDENNPSIPNVAYLNAIDGLGVEDLWYNDNTVSDWTAGDLSFIQNAIDAGKFVLATSYPTENARQDAFIINALDAGLIPFVANRDLTGIIDPANHAIAPAMVNLDINVPWAGSSGSDSFLFDTALGTANVDRIFDFDSLNDLISLKSVIFAAAGPVGTLAPDAFVTGSAAADADDRIIYNNGTGALIYDSNGSTAGGATQFATLSAGLALTNTDFRIV